ncbi:MAG TPA: hypothetical protein VF844_06760, partial [Ktedonobacteraceae bacterium]
LHNPIRALLQPFSGVHPVTNSDLLVRIQQATTPRQLTKLVDQLQSRIYNLPPEDQAITRKQLADTLSSLALHASQAPLRLEAAGWLRMFVQAAYLSQPEQIFVTLVTAATRASIDSNEQRAYLKMIFDCFWPFRYPYAAYTWEQYPNNNVFYSLVPLLSQSDDDTQAMLIAIFAELPSLDDPEISAYLLPLALAWSDGANPERRQRITTILSLMSHSSAQEALSRLQADPNPSISTSAKRAAEKVRRA